MIGSFELVVMLAVVIIIGFAFWIWKSKPDWSTPKKVVITVVVLAGLIAVTFFGLFILSAPAFDRGIRIEKIGEPLNKFEYAEITGAELDNYPALKKAVITERGTEMNGTEWKLTQQFLDEKWRERTNQFAINETDLEEELNKSIVTARMRNIFASAGYPILENSYIRHDGDRWYVMKTYLLFSITNPEVENELNSINITAVNVPSKVRSSFAESGFSLPESARISGIGGKWIIDAGTGYTIMKEEGKLNVYTGDEKTHEILRENEKLKVVYIGPQGSPIFRILEKYYSFEFWVS
jgi:hypothetical protein